MDADTQPDADGPAAEASPARFGAGCDKPGKRRNPVLAKDDVIEIEGVVLEALPMHSSRWNCPTDTRSWHTYPASCA